MPVAIPYWTVWALRLIRAASCCAPAPRISARHLAGFVSEKLRRSSIPRRFLC
jgi:hypothetical protein